LGWCSVVQCGTMIFATGYNNDGECATTTTKTTTTMTTGQQVMMAFFATGDNNDDECATTTTTTTMERVRVGGHERIDEREVDRRGEERGGVE